MKKSFIALAVLGSFAGAAVAQSSMTIYGIIDLGVVKQTKGDAVTATTLTTNTNALGGVGMSNKEVNVAQGTKSRLGFKGVEDLGGGLSAKFDLEHRLLPDTGATNSSGGNNFWDKAIVGITSTSFGEITLGRDYVPAFYAQYLMDPWLNQGIAEVGGTTYAFAGYIASQYVRANDSIIYKVQVGGFTGMLSASMSEAQDVDNRYGVGFMYTNGPLMVTGAYDQAPSKATPSLTAASTTAETDDLMMIGVSYDFGAIKPRLSVARSSMFYGGTTETNPLSVTLAATAPMGSGLIKFGYTQIDWDRNAYGGGTDDTKQQKISLGYEHGLSKRTALYTDVTHGRTKGTMATTFEENKKVTGFDIGVRHAF